MNSSANLIEPVDLYSRAIDIDPFPLYKRLREQYPAYWSPSGNFWVLSRYDDVVRAATDWETFSSSQGNLVDEIPNRAGGTLGTTDPPRHDRLRVLAQSAFARRNIDYLVPIVAGLANEALDRTSQREQFDFVADFSTIVTVGSLFKLLGLPERDPGYIRRLVVMSVSTDKNRKGRKEDLDAAFVELSGFLREQVGWRRRNPQDDLITRLAEAEIDGDRLSDREVILTTSMFVVAGVESLSSFMSMFALNLAEHPEERRKLLADRSLMQGGRYNGPFRTSEEYAYLCAGPQSQFVVRSYFQSNGRITLRPSCYKSTVSEMDIAGYPLCFNRNA